MNFGEALDAVKSGSKIARSGWNGKGMYLFLVVAWDGECVIPIKGQHDKETQPFLAMKTADDKIVPWLASQTDILATDWEVV